ncbi:DedA family protein [sulfur-oxidizing endosymbiont of Gigantopelta aegis]|uniref:DedA family protein n=1 Tax=sulfur-oxidizing endosymbiont of Gigantopelta aegis TaxID=2794934 RepID=UPI0018DD8F68|nr:DedA family protein [sulfur-oxidizing endosymbiont of Gigantopelta aegis]
MEFLYSIDFSELIKQSQYTGLIVFLIAFLETFLLIGFFFPGSIALIAIGGLIASGHLDLWPTLFWAFAGAVIGDNLSFWIGVYFQAPLKKTRLYQKHQSEFAKGEEFFHQYGIYSVVLGRFIGPIRAVIPAIAGSLGMSGRLFFLVNICSALLWAPIYILPGYFANDIYHDYKQHLQIDFWSLLLIGSSAIIALFFIKELQCKKKQRFTYLALLIIIILLLGITQTAFPD